MTSGLETKARPARALRWAPSKLARKLLLFWLLTLVLLIGGWVIRPEGPRVDGAAPAPVSTNPACDKHRRPDPSGPIQHRLLQRVVLDNADSWLAMRAALTQLEQHPREPLYAGVFKECIKFQYAPSSLLILDGLKSILGDAFVSNPMLNAISLLFFLVMLGAVSQIYVLGLGSDRESSPLDRALPVLLTLAFYPALKSIELGQIQTWLNALFALSVLLYLREKKLWAGVVLGVVATIKPQLAMFLPWALIRKDWAFAKGMGVCAGLVMVVSLFRYGLDKHLEYLGVLKVISRLGESYFANQSFNGLLLRALHLGPNTYFLHDQFGPYHPLVHYGTMLSSLALLGFALFWRPAWHRTDRGLSFCIAALCFTIGSPIAWEHHYGILPVLFAVSFGAMLRAPEKPRAIWIALALAWVLTAVRFAATRALEANALNFLQSHVYFGALILLVLMHGLRRPTAAEASALA